MKQTVCILFCLALPATAPAGTVYQEPQEFITESFAGHRPKPASVWIVGEHKAAVRRIMGHDPDALRVRYWGSGQRTAWILEETGKAHPITVGVVIHRDRLERLKVLVFRESRGDEVRYPFFTDQFRGRRLTGDGRLDREINGISGATLSVRALKKVARLALYLHQQTPYHHDRQ